MSIPAWCECTRGTGPLLLIAPHGGRRPPVDAAGPPAQLRVNDLYTPEITRALAADLHASTVINFAQDRNTLDLNRVSQVRRRAAWFLDLLHDQLAAILQRHDCAEVWFIHGWNIGQPRCDLGIGAVETAAGLQIPSGSGLAVSRPYYEERIGSLRAAGAARGIAVTVGAKYPASHRNNVLQLFAQPAGDDPCSPELAAWAAAGRVNALQLELGIPLRWPGEWRERFRAAVVAAFVAPPTPRRGTPRRQAPRPPRALPDAARDTSTMALQFYDPEAGIGLIAGIGRTGPAALAGRLLLFLGGQRVALYTGEGGSFDDLGLALAGGAGAAPVRFRGSMLLLDDAGLYVDLEAALAASRLVSAEVELRFLPSAAAAAVQFGRIEGRVVVDGGTRVVRTGAFANAGGGRVGGPHAQTALAADFGAGKGVLTRSGWHGSVLALQFGGATARSLDGARLVPPAGGDGPAAGVFRLCCAGLPTLRARPLSRMAILRPAGRGAYVHVSFGVARFEWDRATGWGLYEHAEPVGAVPRPASARA